MDDNVIGALAVICIFGLPVLGWIVSRVLAHQERMEMMRRGIVPPPDARDMRKAMKYGWMPGQPMPGASNQYYYPADYYTQRQLRRGVQVACVGFALLIGLGFIGYRGDGHIDPGPWLLGGLIPLFVGVAQIIGAVMSGATFGPQMTRQHFGPADTGASASAPPPNSGMPPGPTYGGWRPGSTPEIEKPASPPDYR